MFHDGVKIPSVVDLVVDVLMERSGGHDWEALVADVWAYLWVRE